MCMTDQLLRYLFLIMCVMPNFPLSHWPYGPLWTTWARGIIFSIQCRSEVQITALTFWHIPIITMQVMRLFWLTLLQVYPILGQGHGWGIVFQNHTSVAFLLWVLQLSPEYSTELTNNFALGNQKHGKDPKSIFTQRPILFFTCDSSTTGITLSGLELVLYPLCNGGCCMGKLSSIQKSKCHALLNVLLTEETAANSLRH